MFWPEEMKQSVIVGQFMGQIRMVTSSGIKGKDDCIDTISMLGFLTPWRPSDTVQVKTDEIEVFGTEDELDETSALDSYIA